MTKAIQLNAFGSLTATLIPSDTTLTLDTEMGVTDSYFVLQNPLDPTQIEWVGYTWITNNGDGTYTYNSLARYLSPVSSTTMGTSPYTWSIGSTATIIAMPSMYAWSGGTATNTINTTITSSRSLAIGDAYTITPVSSSSSISITVPSHSSVGFSKGTQIDFIRMGTWTVSFVAGLGVTISSVASYLSIANQLETWTLINLDWANSWFLSWTLST